MRKPLYGFKWETEKDETTVTFKGGPAHLVGLDPGEYVCRDVRCPLCDGRQCHLFIEEFANGPCPVCNGTGVVPERAG